MKAMSPFLVCKAENVAVAGTCSCSNTWRSKKKARSFSSRSYSSCFCSLSLTLFTFFATIRICCREKPKYLDGYKTNSAWRKKSESTFCLTAPQLSAVSVQGTLWSSFHRRWKGVPQKPLSRIWEQRQHSEAPAIDTGLNAMLAREPRLMLWPETQLCLESDQLLLVITTDRGLSFSCYEMNATCGKPKHFGAAKLCRIKSQWEIFWSKRKRNKSALPQRVRGFSTYFSCCAEAVLSTTW